MSDAGCRGANFKNAGVPGSGKNEDVMIRTFLTVSCVALVEGSGVTVNGVALIEATPTTHVIVVEETGSRADFADGLCAKSLRSGVPQLGALLSCSLHAAIAYGNALSEDVGRVMIVIAPGLYFLEEALPPITRSMYIMGGTASTYTRDPLPLANGAAQIEGGVAALRRAPLPVATDEYTPVLDCLHRHRAFEIGAGVHVTLHHLAIRNGYAYRGGAILQAPAGDGWTRMLDVQISSSQAVYGGALYTSSRAVLWRSTLRANYAAGCGGAIYAHKATLGGQGCSFQGSRDFCHLLDLDETMKAEDGASNHVAIGAPIVHDAAAWSRERSRRLRRERDAALTKGSQSDASIGHSREREVHGAPLRQL